MALNLTDDDLAKLQLIINKTPTEWGVLLLNFFAECHQRQRLDEMKRKEELRVPDPAPPLHSPQPNGADHAAVAH